LELQKKAMLAKIELDNATATDRKASATQKNITAIYSGVQAAQVIATVPGIAPMADQLLLSGGFQDANAAPIVAGQQVPGIQAPAPPVVSPEGAENTDPMHPAIPAGAAEGMMAGIETPRADGVMA
ncbi:MAG: hypothetical protein UY82_C0050G0001, partial [Candidatus Uhrbacteria bacterium GW2011_GWC2_53_7]